MCGKERYLNMKTLHPLFKIKTKAPPYSAHFIPNAAQRHYREHMTSRDLILKARQLGFSTLIKMDDLDTALTVSDISCVTVANTIPNAREIFSKIRYALQKLPQGLKDLLVQETDNLSKAEFSHTLSSILVTTSARSATTQRLHISEFSHMLPYKKEEVLTGSLQAVPLDGYAVVETTAKGRDEFYQLWVEAIEGKNEWTPHFYNWTWDNTYTMDPPVTAEWKDQYQDMAKMYGLIPNIQEQYQLTDGQFYWYFNKALSLKEFVKQEYPTTWREAFLTSAKNVFNLVALAEIKTKKPIEILENGELFIWKDPEPGHEYAIGVDTSEGDINSDFGCAGVLDVDTGEQVAELHGRFKDYVFASKLAELGMLYNMAMIGVERNNHGHSVLNSLIHAEEYPNLYIHEDEKAGWPTNAKTKPMMIDGKGGLAEAIQDKLMGVNSEGFVNECYNFEYKNKSTKQGMGAADKTFDDRVMCWAIAWIIRPYVYRIPRDAQGNKLFVS